MVEEISISEKFFLVTRIKEKKKKFLNVRDPEDKKDK